MDEDFPDLIVMSGWQRVDEDHPAGGGVPAYRVVYKTLKTYLPEAELGWPNLVVRWGHGNVDRGGVNLGGAIPTRREGHWLVPQPGTVTIDGQTMTFHPRETKSYEFQAWQEDVEDVFFVEMVLQTTTEDPGQQIAEGRRRLGYLKTLIELSFGPRVLNAQIAEELGEVFPDGHFNRSIHSQVVGNEWQMGLAAVPRAELERFAHDGMEGLGSRSESDRERIALACDWYWRSTQTADLVTEYLELWFVVESVAMPDTSNVRPVRERLAVAFGGTEADWRRLVGQHTGRRDKLVHGQTRREGR